MEQQTDSSPLEQCRVHRSCFVLGEDTAKRGELAERCRETVTVFLQYCAPNNPTVLPVRERCFNQVPTVMDKLPSHSATSSPEALDSKVADNEPRCLQASVKSELSPDCSATKKNEANPTNSDSRVTSHHTLAASENDVTNVLCETDMLKKKSLNSTTCETYSNNNFLISRELCDSCVPEQSLKHSYDPSADAAQRSGKKEVLAVTKADDSRVNSANDHPSKLANTRRVCNGSTSEDNGKKTTVVNSKENSPNELYSNNSTSKKDKLVEERSSKQETSRLVSQQAVNGKCSAEKDLSAMDETSTISNESGACQNWHQIHSATPTLENSPCNDEDTSTRVDSVPETSSTITSIASTESRPPTSGVFCTTDLTQISPHLLNGKDEFSAKVHTLSNSGGTSISPNISSEGHSASAATFATDSSVVSSVAMDMEVHDDCTDITFEEPEIYLDKEVEDDFELKHSLGKGKFGEVKLGVRKRDRKEYALKLINTRRASDKQLVRKEVETMTSLRHPKLLQLYGLYEGKRRMALVLEIVRGGELFERVADDSFDLTEELCCHVIRQVCDGVHYMHRNNFLHLDLKPENILCLRPGGTDIKIIDFGLTRKFNPREKEQVMFGTAEFVAPEIVNYDPIALTTDMWAVGVITYILVSGLSPFLGETDMETLCNVTTCVWDFDDESFDNVSDESKSFIEGLLVKDKRKRRTANDCLLHPWLQRLAGRPEPVSQRKLPKAHHKSFVTRRRWQRAVNAMKALQRMGLSFSNSKLKP